MFLLLHLAKIIWYEVTSQVAQYSHILLRQMSVNNTMKNIYIELTA